MKRTRKFITCCIVLILAILLAGCERNPVDGIEDALVHQSQGDYLWSKGKFDEAVAEYTLAIQLDPDNAEEYYGRGIAYLWMGDSDMFIMDLDQAIRLDPNYADAYFIRGVFYSIIWREYDKAIEDLTQVIRLEPNAARGYIWRVYMYYEINDFDGVIADCTRAILLEPNKPDNSDIYFQRGSAYAAIGDLDKAIADWEAALELKPNYSLATQYIERARQQQGR